MRRFLLLLMLLPLLPLSAQKYACVNTQYILNSMPDYVTALTKINKYAAEWQEELEAKQQEVDNLRQQYQQEAYLLPDNLKQRRQDEIRTKEAALRALQQQHFGAGGDLDQRRAELMKPVQNRISNAIERVAREKNYAFVFDKAGSATVLYAAEKYDISAQVLEILGVKPGAAAAAAANAANAGSSDKGTDKGSASNANKKSSPDTRALKK